MEYYVIVNAKGLVLTWRGFTSTDLADGFGFGKWNPFLYIIARMNRGCKVKRIMKFTHTAGLTLADLDKLSLMDESLKGNDNE